MGHNPVRLLAAVLGNAAAYILFLRSDALSVADFGRVFEDLRELVPGILAPAVLAVVNGLVSPKTKARIVYWRWSDPLPGCRAFTKHGPADHRVDLARLARHMGEIPAEGREQNATWYRLYQTVKSDPAVRQGHRDYLFTRDYAALSLLMLFGLGGMALYQFDSWPRAMLYVACLAGQYLVVRHVAAGYGVSFVTTVLAVKAAEE